ncbi:hypothetical protein ACFFRR_006899 [Megaselia abdita]
MFHRNLILLWLCLCINGLPELKKDFECGNAKNIANICFKDSSPDIMEFISTVKVDETERDIDNRCTVFEEGTKCFDTYAKKCIHPKNMELYYNMYSGAKEYFEILCNDKQFRVKYLRHSKCFDQIKYDWINCKDELHAITTQEIQSENKNVTEKYMNLCCAREAFQLCVGRAADYKCSRTSVAYVREEAQALTNDKIFKNCNKFQNMICGAISRSVSNLLVTIFIFVSIVGK